MALPLLPTDYASHWAGTESGGIIPDELGSYPMSIVGSSSRAIGRVGEAAETDALSSYYSIVGLGSWFQGKSEITLAGFFRPRSGSAGMGFTFLCDNTSHVDPYYRFGLIFTPTTINAFCNGYQAGNGQLSHPGTYDPDAYYHIAIRLSGGELSIHLEGKLVATQSGHIAIGSCSPNVSLGRIPMLNGVSDAAMVSFNRLKLFSRGLSDKEIEALSLERPKTPAANLELSYQFADAIGSSLPNSAPGATQITDAFVSGAVRTPMNAGIGGNFDGLSARVIAPNPASMTSALTVSGKFVFKSAGSKILFSARKSGALQNWLFYYNGTEFRFILWGSSTYVASYVWTPDVNKEYHLGATYDGAAIALWIDGVSVATLPASGPVSADSDEIYIGYDSLDGYSSLKCCSPRFYSAALDAADMALLATEVPQTSFIPNGDTADFLVAPTHLLYDETMGYYRNDNDWGGAHEINNPVAAKFIQTVSINVTCYYNTPPNCIGQHGVLITLDDASTEFIGVNDAWDFAGTGQDIHKGDAGTETQVARNVINEVYTYTVPEGRYITKLELRSSGYQSFPRSDGGVKDITLTHRDIGAYIISGVITEDGVPVSAKARVYHRNSGRLAGDAQSGGDGAYEILVDSPGS